MTAHYFTLLLTSALGAMVGFLGGWWRGRRDFAVDLDDDLGAALDKLRAIPTHCGACGSAFEAACPKGCAADSSGYATEKKP